MIEEQSEVVIVRISDKGHGMNQKVLDKIFDPFFSTKPEGEGTGLGLAITLGLLKELQSEIDVQVNRKRRDYIYPNISKGTNMKSKRNNLILIACYWVVIVFGGLFALLSNSFRFFSNVRTLDMILVMFSLFGNILCSNLTLFLGADNEINIQAEKAIFPYCSLAGVSSFVGIFGATTNFDITSLYIFIFIVGVLQLGFLIYILCSLSQSSS